MSLQASKLSIASCEAEQGPSPDEIQDGPPHASMSMARKALIIATASWISLCTSFGSTSLFPAADMIVAEFSTSPKILEISNAITLLCMGSSSFLWSPIASMIGSRTAYNLATFVLLVFCAATAAAPSIEVFFTMRLLGGFQGTWFMVGGQNLIADLFVPTQRGTAVGFFQAGTVIGPALGPCIGGIVVTYTSWRVIFWIQTGMTAVGLILAVLFLPPLDSPSENSLERKQRLGFVQICKRFDPSPTLDTLLMPKSLVNNLICAFLSWTLYTLLASPHHVLNKALNLNTPILGGLFYLAPGSGFLIGTIIGGRYADTTVKKYLTRRGGERWPEDRLNAALVMLIALLPLSLLIYGWSAQYRLGGIAVPAISAFLAGFGVMAAFSPLNTYAVECAPHHRKEIVTGKYLLQNSFSAAASAATIPLMDSIGVGLTTTISAVLVLLGGLLAFTLARHNIITTRRATKESEKSSI